MSHSTNTSQPPSNGKSPWGIFLIFLRLGLTSFGGPVAHIGYFRDEFVVRRKWLSERSYADLVALCQFLPGPASSQVGLALGLSRSGYSGAFAAWLGFTAPSAIALILFALGISHYSDAMPTGVLHGLKVVAVAVVAQAVWGMARNLCPDTQRITLMALAACGVLMIPSAWAQVGVILLTALAGLYLYKPGAGASQDALPISISRRSGTIWLSLFFILLLGLPVLNQYFESHTLSIIDAFYRAGSLVFGGGHVVMPLLQAEVVPTGWVNNEAFLAGYGATQAVPGPLFTFAAFLGASITESGNAGINALICLVAIFTPSFLLVAGALPFWEAIRSNVRTQAALMGVNAGVVGILLAALFTPVWSSAILSPQDFALGLFAFIALMFWKLPPWLVVLGSAIIAGVISFLVA